MDDFTFDVVQKKRIAASARHRVNGSKSKFVGLPSDHMTQAQLNKLNGPCDTYNLNRPMSWEAFKAMPLDLQQRYLDGLASQFGVGASTVSRDLFCLSDSALGYYIRNNGLKAIGTKSTRLNAESRALWDSWLNPPVDEPVDEPVEDQAEVVAHDVLEEIVPCEPVVLPEPIRVGFTMIPREEGLRVADLAATFTGNFEPEEFMKWMAMLPMPEGKVKIRVEVTTE